MDVETLVTLGSVAIILIIIYYIYLIYKSYKEVKKTHKPESPFKNEYKFEIFKGKKKEWRFRFVAPNGEIMAASEGYKNHKDCLDSIDSIQRNAPDAEIKEVEK